MSPADTRTGDWFVLALSLVFFGLCALQLLSGKSWLIHFGGTISEYRRNPLARRKNPIMFWYNVIASGVIGTICFAGAVAHLTGN